MLRNARIATALSLSALALASLAPAAAAKPEDPAKAVRLYTQDIEPLTTIGGVPLGGSAYGSSFVASPKGGNRFYGLTDRGPNVDGPNGEKVEPVPSFTPAIGEFKLQGKKATLVRSIPLSAPDGSPYNGQVSTLADTGETIIDLDGNVLPKSPYGYDPEGLVALDDGTFWVSDEYGPFITHFSATGRELERLSPYDASLPAELKSREPNKGMEGLAVTPDGRTLVGIMQAGLNAPGGPKSKKVTPLRIVTVDLASRTTHEYLYLLHNTGGADTAVSEISALSDTELVVDERDGDVEPDANKKLWRIDLSEATDVGPASTVPGSSYDATKGGLLLGGRNIETITGTANTAAARTALQGVGITPWPTSSSWTSGAWSARSTRPAGASGTTRSREWPWSTGAARWSSATTATSASPG